MSRVCFSARMMLDVRPPWIWMKETHLQCHSPYKYICVNFCIFASLFDSTTLWSLSIVLVIFTPFFIFFGAPKIYIECIPQSSFDLELSLLTWQSKRISTESYTYPFSLYFYFNICIYSALKKIYTECIQRLFSFKHFHSVLIQLRKRVWKS